MRILIILIKLRIPKSLKEVQTAYKTIMDDRKRGFTNRTYGNTQGAGYNGQSQSSYQYNGNDQAALMRLLDLLMLEDFKKHLIFWNKLRLVMQCGFIIVL